MSTVYVEVPPDGATITGQPPSILVVAQTPDGVVGEAQMALVIDGLNEGIGLTDMGDGSWGVEWTGYVPGNRLVGVELYEDGVPTRSPAVAIYIEPAPDPPAARNMGSLPFPYMATLCERDGQEVALLTCAVWPARGSTDGARGRHHDHTGEAPLVAQTILSVPNRVLRLDGGPMEGEYVIVNAIAQPFVPHVQLELRSRGA